MVEGIRALGWGYPPSRPFVLLGVYFGIAALQLATVAARPPFPDTAVGALWVLAGVHLLLLLALGFAWARSANAALPFLVAPAVLCTGASAFVAAGGQGQLVSGFYLAVLGLYSGYFLSGRAVRMFIALAVVSYGAALIANPRLDSPAYVLAIVVLIVGVTLVVCSLVQRLREEAVHDPLTGALNRRGLQSTAELVHDLDARRDSTTAIIEIDLDGFKAYNDRYGHPAGDELLTSVVSDWTRVLRRTDILARTGGDEFVLILPATTRAEADVLIGRMREINDIPWTAGIVTWEAGEPLPEALKHADAAMYRHKPLRDSRSEA